MGDIPSTHSKTLEEIFPDIAMGMLRESMARFVDFIVAIMKSLSVAIAFYGAM